MFTLQVDNSSSETNTITPEDNPIPSDLKLQTGSDNHSNATSSDDIQIIWQASRIQNIIDKPSPKPNYSRSQSEVSQNRMYSDRIAEDASTTRSRMAYNFIRQQSFTHNAGSDMWPKGEGLREIEKGNNGSINNQYNRNTNPQQFQGQNRYAQNGYTKAENDRRKFSQTGSSSRVAIPFYRSVSAEEGRAMYADEGASISKSRQAERKFSGGDPSSSSDWPNPPPNGNGTNSRSRPDVYSRGSGDASSNWRRRDAYNSTRESHSTEKKVGKQHYQYYSTNSITALTVLQH